MVHGRRYELAISHDENVHAASFGYLAGIVHKDRLIKTTVFRLSFGKRARNISSGNLATKRKGIIRLTNPRADRATNAFGREIISELDAIKKEVFFYVVETWGNVEIGGVDERTEIDRTRGLV